MLDAIKGDYGLIIPNAEVRNADLSKLLQPQRLPLVKDRIYKSSEGSLLLADVANYLTFIGCVIIKRGCGMRGKRRNISVLSLYTLG